MCACEGGFGKDKKKHGNTGERSLSPVYGLKYRRHAVNVMNTVGMQIFRWRKWRDYALVGCWRLFRRWNHDEGMW
jgi:hypothetical protein